MRPTRCVTNTTSYWSEAIMEPMAVTSFGVYLIIGMEHDNDIRAPRQRSRITGLLIVAVAAIGRVLDCVDADLSRDRRRVVLPVVIGQNDLLDDVVGNLGIGRDRGSSAVALAGGMPLYKYVSNRVLTLIENILVGQKLSEHHTGYRAWSRRVLETLPIDLCSEDFVFDNEMLAQSIYAGFRIGEISCPTKYFPEASSINFRRSVIYGIGVLRTAVRFRLHRWGVARSPIFAPLDSSVGPPEAAKPPELAR